MISVRLKVFPPFVHGSHTIERVFNLRSGASVKELIVLAAEHGVLRVDNVLEEAGVKEGVVILVNGRTVFNLEHTLSNGDKVAIMPLAPGG